jgi:hypothetical protein
MESTEEDARRLLHEMSESLDIDLGNWLAWRGRSSRPRRTDKGSSSGVPYRFLPFSQPERCQNGRNRGTQRLKLRKTLHLADTIGGGKRIQENPPPGTSNFGINRQTVRGRDFRLVQAPALKAHATTNFELMGYPAIRNRKDSTSRFQS